jgi:hypothetical protein
VTIIHPCTKSLILFLKGCVVTSEVCCVCAGISCQVVWCSTLHCPTQYTSHASSGQDPFGSHNPRVDVYINIPDKVEMPANLYLKILTVT